MSSTTPEPHGTWHAAELRTLARVDEIGITSYRPDGTLRPQVTVWAVVHDGQVYVRSARGPLNGWFRRAVGSGRGRVRCAGVDREVLFTVPGDHVHAGVDAAYHAAYDRYGAGIVGSVTGPALVGATLRLDPVG